MSSILVPDSPIKKFYLCDGKLPCSASKNCQVHNKTGLCRFTTNKEHAIDGGHIFVNGKMVDKKGRFLQ